MVSPPRFRWEWNLNTIATLVGFFVLFGSVTMQWSELRTGRDVNARNIDRHEGRITAVESAHATLMRALDNHELRLTAVEAQTRDAAAAMRAVEAALSTLSSDIRVTREIVQRMEEAQRRNGQTSVPARH